VIKILLLEDYTPIHTNARDSWDHWNGKSPETQVEYKFAISGEEVLDIVNTGWIPDVALLDHRIAGAFKGSDVAYMFVNTFPAVKLLSVSAMHEKGYPRGIRHLGKSNITKQSFLQLLIQWVRTNKEPDWYDID
jgi:hypothetical protein